MGAPRLIFIYSLLSFSPGGSISKYVLVSPRQCLSVGPRNQGCLQAPWSQTWTGLRNVLESQALLASSQGRQSSAPTQTFLCLLEGRDTEFRNVDGIR